MLYNHLCGQVAAREGQNGCSPPWLFSNSGPVVKLSMNILAGSRVLSAVGTLCARPQPKGETERGKHAGKLRGDEGRRRGKHVALEGLRRELRQRLKHGCLKLTRST